MQGLDPRFYQIITLSLLIVYGVLWLDIGIAPENALAIPLAALATQWLLSYAVGLPRCDFLSAIITSLSLTLLLRTDQVSIAALAGCLAIASKFLIRVHGKHVFNPANFAIVISMLVFDRAWISSGQWGSATLAAIGLISLGLIVLTRARRAETSFSFLLVFAGLVFARAIWLGDPMSIPLHQLQNGALLIFAFFMISDPKTTPDAALARVAFGSLTALVAFGIQFGLFIPGAPIFALIVCAPLTPILDHFLRGDQYLWRRPSEGV